MNENWNYFGTFCVYLVTEEYHPEVRSNVLPRVLSYLLQCSTNECAA